MLLAQDHIATDTAIAASDIPQTLLRDGRCSENYTGALGAAIQHGAIIGAAGERRVSSAARKDYAAAVTKASDKPVAYVSMPEAEYSKALQGFGLPKGFAHALADSDIHVAKGALQDDSRTLSRLIGRPTTPMAETVAAAL